MRGHASTDSPASIADGCKSLQTNGVCSEETWPFNLRKITARPPRDAYDEAAEHKIHTPAIIQKNDIFHVKDSIAQGKPVVVGIILHSEFWSADAKDSGKITMPGPNSQNKGGHAVLFVGYDENRKHWIVRNSWGEDWGDRG